MKIIGPDNCMCYIARYLGSPLQSHVIPMLLGRIEDGMVEQTGTDYIHGQVYVLRIRRGNPIIQPFEAMLFDPKPDFEFTFNLRNNYTVEPSKRSTKLLKQMSEMSWLK